MEEKASEPYDPYDIYCNVLDEAQAEKDLADGILLDDAGQPREARSQYWLVSKYNNINL